MIYDAAILILLLLFSGFFSSSEIAFIVANKIKLEIRSKKNKAAEKSAMYYVKNPHIFFSTILISNNIVNITFASLTTVFFVKYFRLGNFSILLISTFILFIFGELLPKYISREFADRMILITSLPLRLMTYLLYPFVKITSSISGLLLKPDITREEEKQIIDKEDLQVLIDESSAVGNVTEEDSDIISKIFELRDQKIYETMTPRTEIVGVEINTSIDEVITTFIDSGFSKLPLYEENLDNIKGVVFAYDMFNRPKNLSSVTREIIFVPETKRSLEMLNEFLDKQISIAIVIDEFGGTAGLITVEDIIEEMLGEIQDEYDEDDEVCKKINAYTFVTSGRVEIDHLNEECGLQIPEGDYETIAGFVTSNIGRIPLRGENLEIGNLKFSILHSDKTKINLMKIFLQDDIQN